MTTDITNADRAGWALFALHDFVGRTRSDTFDEAVGDLIVDLLHLARAGGLQPGQVVNRALTAMEVEVVEDDEGDMANIRAMLRSLFAEVEDA